MRSASPVLIMAMLSGNIPAIRKITRQPIPVGIIQVDTAGQR